MKLKLNDTIRVETDDVVIANLKRKGWEECLDAVPEPSPEDLFREAKLAAEAHILSYYTPLELIGLLDYAQQGNSSALSIRAWCKQIEGEALSKRKLVICDFAQFGEPLPYESCSV